MEPLAEEPIMTLPTIRYVVYIQDLESNRVDEIIGLFLSYPLAAAFIKEFGEMPGKWIGIRQMTRVTDAAVALKADVRTAKAIGGVQ
jgi:hypothetical protein